MKIPAPAKISKSLSFILVFLSALSLGFVAGCGSGSGSAPPGTPVPGQTTNVTLLLSSARVPNFQSVRYPAGSPFYGKLYGRKRNCRPKRVPSSQAMSQAGGYPYTSVTTLTLVPQTINGTVTGISASGSFQLYTVQLAPYDPIATLPAAQSSASNLTNPNTVVVYTNSDTQLLTTSSFAVGSVLRFYGLLFDDDGTLRMDRVQVNDGVAEQQRRLKRSALLAWSPGCLASSSVG